MIAFTIVLFVILVIVFFVIIEEYDEEVSKEKKRNWQLAIMVDITMMVGILMYWLRNVVLVPIVEMYTTEVNMGTLLLAVVLSLLSIDYIIAVAYKLPKVPFLAIAFVLNCMLAPKAPFASLAIVFIMSVCLYGALSDKKVQITVLESALVKAMLATSVIITILNVIGIVLTIVALLIIVSLVTSVSISIETYIWKKKSNVSYADYTDTTEEDYPTTIPMIITKGIVSMK